MIDNEPIRKQAVAEYQRIEEEISSAREQVEAFQSGDLPAYQRWEAQLFGPLLTDLRSAVQAIEEKRGILMEVEDEMFWGRCSPVAAYRRVMKRRESPAPAEEDAARGEWQRGEEREPEPDDSDWGGDRMFGNSDLPPDFDIDAFDRLTPRKQKRFRDDYRMMAMMYEMMTGMTAPELEEVLQREREKRGRGGGERAGGAEEAEERDQKSDRPADRIKELYRKLVRQLHPDSAQELTERERELWHEVQEAYRARDLERMEAVAGRVEIGLGGSAFNLPVQILRRMTHDLLGALKGLHVHISTARKHPAWRFRQKTKELAKIEARRRRALTTELRQVNEELALLSAELDRLAAQASSPGRRRAKKKSPDYMDEFFF